MLLRHPGRELLEVGLGLRGGDGPQQQLPDAAQPGEDVLIQRYGQDPVADGEGPQRAGHLVGVDVAAQVALGDTPADRAGEHVVDDFLAAPVRRRTRLAHLGQRLPQLIGHPIEPIAFVQGHRHERRADQVLHRRRCREDAEHGIGELNLGRLDDGRGHRLLGGEVVVERTLGHIGAIDDVLQVDAAEADLVEDVDRGVDDSLLGDLGSYLHEFKVRRTAGAPK